MNPEGVLTTNWSRVRQRVALDVLAPLVALTAGPAMSPLYGVLLNDIAYADFIGGGGSGGGCTRL